jgi:hypothetical protein
MAAARQGLGPEEGLGPEATVEPESLDVGAASAAGLQAWLEANRAFERAREGAGRDGGVLA